MPDSKTKKILVVEDEEAYSRALVLKLQHSGFEAEGASNGEEALELIQKKDFDLILSDLIMPKMNGFQLLEEIKRLGLGVPVMGLSNLSQADDEKKMRDAGAVDFISKSNSQIVEVIEKVKNFLINK